MEGKGIGGLDAKIKNSVDNGWSLKHNITVTSESGGLLFFARNLNSVLHLSQPPEQKS